jgi:hypothetical protein
MYVLKFFAASNPNRVPSNRSILQFRSDQSKIHVSILITLEEKEMIALINPSNFIAWDKRN